MKQAREADKKNELTEASWGSDDRFKEAFDKTAAGIAFVGMDGRFLHVNQRFCDLVGYSQAEMRAQTFQVITHPDDVETDMAQLRRLMDGEIPNYSMQKRYVCKGGSVVWVNLIVSLVRSSTGEPAYLIGSVYNISDQKRAENELAKLAAIVESSDDAIIGKSLDGIIETWNQGAERIFGYTAEEALGRSIMFLIPPDRQAEELQILERLRRGERLHHFETERISKDGRHLSVSLTASPIKDSAGRIVGVSKVARDITERKRAEASLRESVEQFRLFYEHSPIPYQSLDGEGRFVAVNKAFLDTLGYEAEEIIGHFVGDLLPPEDLPLFRERFPRFKERGCVRGADYRLRCKDGRIIDILLDGNIGYTADGVFQQTHCVWHDVTQRKQQDQAQRRQADFDVLITGILSRFASCTGPEIDEQIQTTLQEMGSFIGAESAYLVLISQDYTSWCVLFEANTTERERLIDKYQNQPMGLRPWIEQRILAGESVQIGTLDDLPPEAAQDKKTYEEEGVKSFLILPLRGRGEQITGCIGLRTYSRPMVWSAEDVRRFRIVADAIANVMERKRVENDLYESRQMLQLILDTIPQRVFWKDRESAYLGCNKPFAEDAGLPSASAIIGKTDYELPWRDTDAEDYRADDRSVIESGVEKIGYEEQQLRPDGTMAWVRTSKMPLLDNQNKIFGVLGTYEDITALRTAREALEQAKEAAEAANRAKDQFIAVLSHELRTPLTPVLATVTAMEEQERLPVGMRADIEVIHRNVELEARLIDDLLDVTRISQGKLNLRPEFVDVHACIQSVVDICQGDIGSKLLDLNIQMEAAEHYVWADPARLRQIFWNLLQNAVKFTFEQGRVSIHTYNSEGRLVIEVADNGIGIEPQAMLRIFNAFEQGEKTWTRRFGGLGLGLSIAKALAEMHHGSLTASSEGQDKGAIFSVKLDTVTPAHELAKPTDETGTAAHESRRILLVEDHPDTLQILARLLRRWGYGVTTASDVQSALERVTEQKFNLLISDLGLPDGSGLDIMQKVKERYKLQGIALSGYGTDEDIRTSIEAGFTEHLTKPVSFSALQNAIQRILDKQDPKSE